MLHLVTKPAPAAETASPSIIDALAMWSSWHLDVPPVDATGDYRADLRLADAFRMLAYLQEPKKQLHWIERMVFSPSDCLGPGETPDPVRKALILWWLALYHARLAPCSNCHGHGTVFECSHWPGCNCPAGAMVQGCPGRSVPCPNCSGNE